MVHIFVINIFSMTLKDLYDLKNLLPQNRIDKINKFKREQDKIRCLLSYVLPLVALSHFKQQPSLNTTIYYDTNGKPFFEGKSNPFFNISHSGDWVVCAISKQPVGIDIEAVNNIDICLFSPYLSSLEQQLFTDQKNEDLSLFYRIWTLKESLLKTTGHGLSYPLEKICFSEFITKNLDFIMFENEKYNLKGIHLDNHQLCICTKNISIEYSIKELTQNDLFLYKNHVIQ
ncbi:MULTISPECIES: 4'-phosphopantetheinyl transferase family protein [Bacillus cereus group]|uniref:4'-phosphopantetheinyl transferase family protein n=1 Tax=Bacillus cereus group TaxID=86661 RepID=UPI00130DBC65|nr:MULTISPECIES: 4'-phosphopantetheinyl transferase superfamily protein [Bacillus cereus group]MCU5058962.1 4'-phosphopantetheinyl transferase superfamily protein [Bacillus cereus]QKI15635.1 4'-phosphopantetheinyl transferase superfamily protein [Bacillus cereus]USL04268.1 4'-phosphopantetheinyl transferase superfamily protein [Bacillus anthracis]